MSSLFNKYAEKAQKAVNATPLGQYIPPQYQLHGDNNTAANPGVGATTSSAPGTPPPQNAPSSGGALGSQHQQQPQHTPTNASTGAPGGASAGGTVGGGVAGVLRQHGFSTLQNQLRSLQVQYSKGNDRQIQLAITAQKSISLQYEGAGRDAQTYSKELYLWGQEQPEDIKDVTDRLAYLNFVHGSLSTDLANKLDTARGPYKTARATESTAGTLRESGQVTESVSAEAEVEKRNALKHGEAARWKALREYAEKLIILSQASEVLIDECLPDSVGQEYTKKQRTAEIRSTLQHTLDNWHLNPAIASTSPFKTSPPSNTMTLDPRSFGETHRQELAHTPSVMEKQKADQEALAHHAGAVHTGGPDSNRPGPSTTQGSGNAASTGVNPSQLNNSPAPVPVPSSGSGIHQSSSPPTAGSPTIPPTAPLNLSGKHSSGTGAAAVGASVAALGTSAAHSSSHSPSSFSSHTSPIDAGVRPVVAVSDVPPNSAGGSVSTSTHPTVAETGVPIVSATQGGPGPASGSLRASNSPTATVGGGPNAPRFESAAAAVGSSPSWSDPPPATGGKTAPGQTASYETAEEEKKRLEREDRERFLRFGTGLNKPAASSTPAAGVPAAVGSTTTAPTAGSSSAVTGGGAPSAGRPRNETAEEEKKRLEREERERVLRGDGGSGGPSSRGGPNYDPNQDGDQLPSYKEM